MNNTAYSLDQIAETVSKIYGDSVTSERLLQHNGVAPWVQKIEEAVVTFFRLAQKHSSLNKDEIANKTNRQLSYIYSLENKYPEHSTNLEQKAASIENLLAEIKPNAEKENKDIPKGNVVPEKTKNKIKKQNQKLKLKKALKAKTAFNTKKQIKDIRISIIKAWNRASTERIITNKEVLGNERKRHLIPPRQLAIYAARILTSASLPIIGGEFGGRHHTTALHACRKAAGRLRLDNNIEEKILRQVAYDLELSGIDGYRLMNPPDDWTIKPKAPKVS